MFRSFLGSCREHVGKAAVVALAVSPSLVFADDLTFDPAPILAIVTSATTFVTTVGIAVLQFVMIAKGIKWARKAG